MIFFFFVFVLQTVTFYTDRNVHHPVSIICFTLDIINRPLVHTTNILMRSSLGIENNSSENFSM